MEVWMQILENPKHAHVKVSQDCLPRADTRIGVRSTEALLHENVLGPDVAVDYSRTCSKRHNSRRDLHI